MQADFQIETDLGDVTERDLQTAVTALDETVSSPLFSTPQATCTVRLAKDETVKILNRDFRGKDKVTNVLSFPADLETLEPDEAYYGDIILAMDYVQNEAQTLNLPLKDHLQHLIIHGILHLFGFDHMVDTEAKIMMDLEVRILQQLGQPNPYA